MQKQTKSASKKKQKAKNALTLSLRTTEAKGSWSKKPRHLTNVDSETRVSGGWEFYKLFNKCFLPINMNIENKAISDHMCCANTHI